MTSTTRAIIAIVLIGGTITLAAQGERIGQGIAFGALTLITAAQHLDSPR